MKKNYSFVIVLLLIVITNVPAQVLNWNFESVKPNNKAAHWGIFFSQLISIDPETGQVTGDDIKGADELNFSTTDAFSGNHALEMHNALNVTQNAILTGGAQIFTDPNSDTPSYVDTGIDLPIGSSINMLGFYYKYFPQGGDIAQANIEVIGESGTIGTGSVDITGIHTTYQYVYTPIQFTVNEPPLYLRISFTLAKNNTTPTYGTRLIVDDVFVNYATYYNYLLNTNQNQQPQFSVYPTHVDTELNIIKANTIDANYTFKIINSEGRLVKEDTANLIDNTTEKINVEELASGIYFIQTETTSGSFTSKFIKK